MLLALVFVLTAFSAIAVNALTYENGDVLESVDFTELYTQNEYTEAKKFDILLNTYTGYMPIWYRFSRDLDTSTGLPKAPGEGDLYYNLTSEGLDISAVYRYYAGIVLTTDAYKNQSNYCISISMSSSISDYLYFGWLYGDTATSNFEDGDATLTSIEANTANSCPDGVNFRFDSNTQNKLVLNTGWTVESGSETDMYSALKGTTDGEKGSLGKYTFVVENNVCKKVVVSTADAEVVYTHTTGLETDGGYFGMFIRTNTKTIESSALIKKVEVTYGAYVSDAEISNRVMPAEKTLEYTDSVDTKYKAGYVLHNMDFSKVTDIDSTGYFLTNNSTPSQYVVENGVLKVTSGGGAYMLFTANAVPKNIQNYEVKIKFRFTSDSSSYLAFVQSAEMNDEKGTVTTTKNTCVRYNGTVDNATALDETAWAKIVTDYQSGEWVTMTYSALERYCCSLKFECGDNSAILSKTANTLATADRYMGIMFGYASSIEVASIQIVATDDLASYESLVWPAEAGALVQNVSADAIDTNASSSTTTEATTTAATTTAATTASTTAAATTAAEEEKKGCGSSVTGTVLVIGAVASSALAFGVAKKKKEQ